MTSRMHNRLLTCAIVGLVTAAVAMSACGGGSASITEARSDKTRIENPNVSEQDLADLVGGNSTFAFDLYRILSESDDNLFFSPYSISSALAMTYAGARGETEQEMADALSFLLPQERLHPGFNALDLALTDVPELREGQTGDAFQLNIANAVWGEQTYEFLSEYLDTLAESYGAGLQLADFINNFEEARATINAWVSDQTEERIPELLQEGTIDDLTRLVLTNAIYFNASWLSPFAEDEARDGTFYRLDGSEVQTSMMHLKEDMSYGEVDGAQVVRLMYEGFQYAMYVILPPEGEFKAYEENLNAESFTDRLKRLNLASVDITMPRFEFESSFDLPETLKGLGMTAAFDDKRADFSGIDGRRNLYISEVVHTAFVAVDEEGTEAAAATGVVSRALSGPSIAATLVLDRPFLFLIRHLETGSILFLGRVLDPTA